MSEGHPNQSAEHRLGQLARLREAWLENRSTRQFVQIAEEFRRLGEPGAAAELLAIGLEAHPRYLSAQVALGRCRLELGDSAGARDLLEKVVETDSTHPLATRLLVEAYVAGGAGEAARGKLELYRLLNAGDPQIEVLEASVSALEGETSASATQSAGGDSSPLGAAASSGARQEDDYVVPGSDVERGAPVVAPGAGSRAEAAMQAERVGLAAPLVLSGRRGRSAGLSPSRARGLTAPLALGGRKASLPSTPIDSASARVGLIPPLTLQVAVATPAALPRPSEPDSPLRPLEEPLALAELPVASTVGADHPIDSTAPAEAPEPVADTEDRATEWIEAEPVVDAREDLELAEALASAPPEAGLEETSEPGLEAGVVDAQADAAPTPQELGPPVGEAGEPAEEEEPPVELQQAAPPLLETDAVPTAPSAGVFAPSFDAAEVSVPAAAGIPAETTTLGLLYLRQGHSVEAERIFRRVLDREPANDVARDGLRRAMIEADLARGAAGSAPARGVTQRKVQRLTGWLGRISGR